MNFAFGLMATVIYFVADARKVQDDNAAKQWEAGRAERAQKRKEHDWEGTYDEGC